jgi:hypothetical protein
LGHARRFSHRSAISGLPLTADIWTNAGFRRFGPATDIDPSPEADVTDCSGKSQGFASAKPVARNKASKTFRRLNGQPSFQQQQPRDPARPSLGERAT